MSCISRRFLTCLREQVRNCGHPVPGDVIELLQRLRECFQVADKHLFVSHCLPNQVVALRCDLRQPLGVGTFGGRLTVNSLLSFRCGKRRWVHATQFHWFRDNRSYLSVGRNNQLTVTCGQQTVWTKEFRTSTDALALSRDDQRVAVVVAGELIAYDAQTGSEHGRFRTRGRIVDMAFLSDPRAVVTLDVFGKVSVWRFP